MQNVDALGQELGTGCRAFTHPVEHCDLRSNNRAKSRDRTPEMCARLARESEGGRAGRQSGTLLRGWRHARSAGRPQRSDEVCVPHSTHANIVARRAGG